MLLLVSGATKTVNRLAGTAGLGILITPQTGNSLTWARRAGMDWAADNAAFSGFDAAKFRTMCRGIWRRMMTDSSARPPLWITAPDVVADARSTLALWRVWQPELAAMDLPLAFVAQDGLETMTDQIPWDQMTCLFIGGTTEWKLSDAARELAQEAKRRGKFVHVGRVNSKRRVDALASWGCVDTIDGSGFSRFPDTRIPMGLDWLKQA